MRFRLGFALSVGLLGAAQAAERLEEVVVVDTMLRPQSLQNAPVSATVLTADTLQAAGQQHFQDVLSFAPNLNWAGGTSRPRYFQIRGIGEREQYQGAPNPSVGFLIDDIDFSGMGMAATLFDVKQIEVLRGPQGTRYGANALAGLITVRTEDPADRLTFKAETSVADYDTWSIGAAASAPVESLNSAWRVAVQQYRSDGFRKNAFLDREDTNDRDELTVHAKWRWDLSGDTRVDAAFIHADLDNGYDAWAVDNSWTSQSDQPGKDSQRVNGGSLKLTTSAWAPARITAIATLADFKNVNSFDADWGNPEFWAPYTYNFFYASQRDVDNRSLELRLSSPDAGSTDNIGWLVGVYGLQFRERLNELSTGEYDIGDPDFAFAYSEPLASRYRATNVAVFAQVDGALTDRWHWQIGARGEQRKARYRDTSPLSESERDRMWGGNATLTYRISPELMAYGAVSRGYKAGGFNLGRAAALQPSFDLETLLSYELGLKGTALDGRFAFETVAFYMQRRDMQVRTGRQEDPSDPSSYIFVTDNAAKGRNYGIEGSIRWLLLPSLELEGSFGLLKTRASGFVSIGESDALEELPPRAQAHAPNYQVAVSATYRHPLGWMARIDFTALDAFYFDHDHNERSRSYTLTHLRTGYEGENWSVYAWVRNLFDKDYAVRGFFFANDPIDPTPRLFIQHGDPRLVGVTAEWKFGR